MVTMNIFSKLTAGDSAAWRDDPIDGLGGLRMTSADWTLTYELRGPTQLSVTATAAGEGWLSILTLAASATLLPGSYKWAAILSKTDERATVANGVLTIEQDLSGVSNAIDARSVAVKALEDCEKALATFNTTGGKVKRYTIGDRQMEFQTLAELMQLLNYWKLRVNNEVAAAKVTNGESNPKTLRVRFR